MCTYYVLHSESVLLHCFSHLPSRNPTSQWRITIFHHYKLQLVFFGSSFVPSFLHRAHKSTASSQDDPGAMIHLHSSGTTENGKLLEMWMDEFQFICSTTEVMNIRVYLGVQIHLIYNYREWTCRNLMKSFGKHQHGNVSCLETENECTQCNPRIFQGKDSTQMRFFQRNWCSSTPCFRRKPAKKPELVGGWTNPS